MSNPFYANPPAQNADHLMLPGKRLSNAKMKTVNSRIIHQLFVHLLFEICAPAISSDTVTSLSLRREERYELAIHKFFPQFNLLPSFVRGLCSKPHINWKWQIFPCSVSQQWRAQTYWTIGIKQFVSQIVTKPRITTTVLCASSMSYPSLYQCEKWVITHRMTTVSQFETFGSPQSKCTSFQL